jgi:hypothetical protein
VKISKQTFLRLSAILIVAGMLDLGTKGKSSSSSSAFLALERPKQWHKLDLIVFSDMRQTYLIFN